MYLLYMHLLTNLNKAKSLGNVVSLWDIQKNYWMVDHISSFEILY